jgi:NAD(P)-dependent dehydrogenase (short-subunit alcohol dehydrogenase family)
MQIRMRDGCRCSALSAVFSMDLKLNGRTVVVTAAGSGIGLACVKLFLAEGARVVAGDVSTGALSAIDSGTALAVVEGDLLQPDGPARLVAAALQWFGGVDVLVNNIGGAAVRESFLTIADEAWLAMFNRNLMAMIRACRSALPAMMEAKRGAIVNIASTNGHRPDPFMVDYSAAKAAVLSVTKSLSIEFGASGIRINAVSPGPTRTPALLRSIGTTMAAKWGMAQDEALIHYASNVQKMSVGRIGEPEDVAAVAVFLASDLARQVTGAEYLVDGGLLKEC